MENTLVVVPSHEVTLANTRLSPTVFIVRASGVVQNSSSNSCHSAYLLGWKLANSISIVTGFSTVVVWEKCTPGTLWSNRLPSARVKFAWQRTLCFSNKTWMVVSPSKVVFALMGCCICSSANKPKTILPGTSVVLGNCNVSWLRDAPMVVLCVASVLPCSSTKVSVAG